MQGAQATRTLLRVRDARLRLAALVVLQHHRLIGMAIRPTRGLCWGGASGAGSCSLYRKWVITFLSTVVCLAAEHVGVSSIAL